MEQAPDLETDADITVHRPSALGGDIGLFLLRVSATLALFYYQLWDHLVLAWRHLWSQEEWDLIAKFADLRLPLADSIAPIFVLSLSAAALGWVLGLFTRLAALAAMLLLVFAMLSLVDLSTTLNPQAMVLYLAVAICLFFAGAGRFSLDYLLVGKRREIKRLRKQLEQGG